MKTRLERDITAPELLAAIVIVAFVSSFLAFAVVSLQNHNKFSAKSVGEKNIGHISYSMIQYMQDNDEQPPRAGWDCRDHASDPTVFKRGEQNQCGGDDWQNAIAPFLTVYTAFVSPADQSSVGEGPWGGGTGTNLNTTDGNISVLYNDLLSHEVPTKAGGYADLAHEDKRANGLKLMAIKTPAECIMLAEGHGGWDKCSTKTPPLLVATDWTGSTNLQNKWHHEYTITGNYTGLMSTIDYSGVTTIRHGLPFYNDGGNVAFLDGHQEFIKYSNPDGSPILCKSIPWTKSMDPHQRNKDKDSCADPNNPIAAGWGGSNWF